MTQNKGSENKNLLEKLAEENHKIKHGVSKAAIKQGFSIEENKKIYYEHFNPDYAISLAKNIVSFIDDYYFRSRFIGFDPIVEKNNPPRPMIFAANHSGMAFPWDAIIFASSLVRRQNYELTDAVRALTAPMLSQTPYMNPFMVENFWKKAGGIDATLENFETMMAYEESNILIYPEGVPGIGKGFDKKYNLQRYSTSFIRMALKYKVDIIPIATVNGEYINPYSYKSDEINKLANKIGIPFVPLGPLTPLVPFQPWAYYFGLPAKLTFVRGERIKVYEMTDKPLEKMRKKELHYIRDAVQKQMQIELTAAVAQYGQDPYELEELGDIWSDNKDKMLYMMPSGWPLLFAEHERLFYSVGKDYQISYDNAAFFQSFLQHPEIMAFLIPVLGWPMLLKWKGVI